jgi:N-ethylmaleimide reductase
MSKLFEPIKLGAVTLSHRIALAPLTRMRATPGSLAPQDLNAIHYGQRATPGGLLIAEASQVLPGGSAAPNTPGSYSAEQTAGWRKVVNAIHSKGGIVFLQLWHVGRLSHSSFQPDGQVAVAPSAIAASGEGMTADWKREKFETPRELKTEEIPGIVEAYRVAAQNAKEAGFDGCEVHSANGLVATNDTNASPWLIDFAKSLDLLHRSFVAQIPARTVSPICL